MKNIDKVKDKEKEKQINFFVGQVMKVIGKKISPVIVKEKIEKGLKNV